MQHNEPSVPPTPREIALRWIRGGRAVVPIPFQSKKPVIKEWPELQITEDTVDDYFNSSPQNIGVILGDPSAGLVDIDLDCAEACELALSFFPSTVTFGRASNPDSHFLFICPGAKTKKYQHEGMLLEIRSTGCQTLVPGSVHPEGELIEGTSGKAVRISNEDLVKAAGCTAAAALLARQWKTIIGSRHEATLALAGALLHSGWPYDQIHHFVHMVVLCAQDEETSDRVLAVKYSANQYDAGKNTTGWPTFGKHFDANVVTKIREWLAISDGVVLRLNGKSAQEKAAEPEEWPEKQPLHRELPPAESYPIDALGDVLGPMAHGIMETVQCPDAVAGQSVLAAASLAAQAHANIAIDGREHPLVNFLITVAETGERKTAADKTALAPIFKFQHDRGGTYQEKMVTYEVECKAWKRAVDEATGKKNETIQDKKDALLALGPEPTRPISPILITEEPTYEGLVKALAQDYPSMGLFSDEGGRFIGGHAMQSDNQLKSAAGLSKLWDGSPITRTRGGEGNIVLYGRRVSLHLMVQPNVSQLFLGNDLLLGQGLLSRCLVAYPLSTIGERVYRAESLSDRPATQKYISQLRTLLEFDLPLADGTRNELRPRDLVLAPDAKHVWVAFHDHVEALCREDRELYPIRGLAAKAAEHVLRLAGVLALTEDVLASAIMQRHIEAGIALSEHYLSEAQRLFEGAAEDTDLRLACRLFAWCVNKISSPSRISRHVHLQEIYQLGPYRIRDKATAKRILYILADHGWIRPIEGGVEIDGQRRRQVWEVRS